MTFAGYCLHPYELLEFYDYQWNQEADAHSSIGFGQAPSWQVGLSYPSPPMSGTSSPHKETPKQLPRESSSQDVSLSSVSGSAAIQPSAQTAPSIIQSSPEQQHETLSRSSGPALCSNISTSPSRPTAVEASPITSKAQTPPPEDSTNVQSSGSIGRGGRRSKAHVANACGNCKRAHLSCDVQRPCSRCIATSKADTCRDVPHKKRGRPRLREEGDLSLEPTAGPSTGVFQVEETAAEPRVPRPIIPVSRHRRGDSLQSLRSIESNPSTVSTFSPTYGRPASRSWPQPRTLIPAQASSVPVAFLDLDFAIIKANHAFQQVFAGLQELGGRRLADLMRPADQYGLYELRNRLRREREAREPSHLPPIMEAGQDPLNGIGETEIDRITYGFSDSQMMLTYRLPSAGEQPLATRIRLAKTSIYFVVVTLPPLPTIGPSAYQSHSRTSSMSALSPGGILGPPLQAMAPFSEPAQASTAQIAQSAPPSLFHQHPSMMPGSFQTAPGFSWLSLGYPQQNMLQRQPVTSPQSSASAHLTSPQGGVPRSSYPQPSYGTSRRLSQPQPPRRPSDPSRPFQPAHADQAQGYGNPMTQPSSHQARPSGTYQPTGPSSFQLPAPIASQQQGYISLQHQHAPQRPITSSHSESSQQGFRRNRRDTLGTQMSSDPEDNGSEASRGSPRKRRRLGIEDVLHK